MQVVANQQHAAATRVSKPRNQGVKLGLASEIDAANGLVEHKQIRLSQKRASENHALQLAAGDARQLAIADVAGANFGQYTTEVDILGRLAEGQEAFDRQRHGVVDVEALRHIADAGIGAADQHPVMGTLEPEKQADKGRLARTIRADQGDDLLGTNVDVDVIQHAAAVAAQRQSAAADQGRRIERRALIRVAFVVTLAATLMVGVGVLQNGHGSTQCPHKPATSTTRGAA